MGSRDFLLDFSLLQEDDDEDLDYSPSIDLVQSSQENGDLIATRTRSKFSIQEPLLESIQLPDFDEDLYEINETDDKEWSDFCQSLFNDPGNDDEYDENDDPEYVATIDDLNLEEEGSRSPRTSGIPHYEIDDLIQDIEQFPVPEVSSAPNLFDENAIRIFQDQMIQLVQIQTQIYFMTRERMTLIPLASQAKHQLLEINYLAQKNSLLNIPNLSSAVKLVDSWKIKEVKERLIPLSWRPLPLSGEIKSIIASNPQVFLCECLIPRVGFYDVTSEMKEKRKIIFLPNEDYLITMGLEEFTGDSDYLKSRHIKMISKFLIPAKTEQQIKIHIKNVKRKNLTNNPIVCYFNNQPIPPCDPHIPVDRFKVSFDLSQCPEWLKIRLSRSSNMSPSPFKQAHAIIKKYISKPRAPLKSLINTSIDSCDEPSDTPIPMDTICDDDQPTQSTETNDRQAETEQEDIERDDIIKDRECDFDEEEVDQDEETDLAALMAASSTIINNKLERKKDSKKDLMKKQIESTEKLLLHDWQVNDPDCEFREQALVEHFLTKAQEHFNCDEHFINFLQLLSNFHESRSSIGSLSKKNIASIFIEIEKFLESKNALKLLDELVLFLNIQEAQMVGKTFEFYFWKRFTCFMRKLEVLSSSDTQLLSRFCKTLSQLKQNEPNCDKARIRSAVNKVLNGHSYLMAEFSSLCLEEKPLDAYLNVCSQFADQFIWKSPNTLTRGYLSPLITKHNLYGTKDCPCTSCHQDTSKVKKNHCIKCSINVVEKMISCEPVQVTAPSITTTPSGPSPKKMKSDPKSDVNDWTIDEDKQLIQFLQGQIDYDDEQSLSAVFDDLAKNLNRAVDQVSSRFRHLIDLLNGTGDS